MPRGGNTVATLKPDTIFLTFPRSDGDPTQRPPNTEYVVDSEGCINWMKAIPEDSGSYCIGWRQKVGMDLAKFLDMPAGKHYALAGWPTGYQMFDHHKGKEDDPRHDAYLIGSKHVNRFRSSNEFYPHAKWLFTDPTMDRVNCECKYCGGGMQRDISLEHGLSKASSQRPSRTDAVPYAAVRRVPKPSKPAKTIPLRGPDQVVSRNRDTELRRSYPHGKPPITNFRKNELVWCSLKPAIKGPGGSFVELPFWPALVRDVKFKKVTQPNPLAPPVDGTRSPGPTAISSGSILQSDIIETEEPAQPPWLTLDVYFYDLKFLGCSCRRNVTESEVLPYQAWSAPFDLLQYINELPINGLDTNSESITRFNPMPSVTAEENGTPAPSLTQAAPAFTLATEIAANIANYWTPTDDWTFTMALPSNAPATLAESLNIASQSNSAPFSTTPTSLNPNQTFTQTRFQGLWWGPERIWMDDLVRLKFHRSQLSASEHIYPSSGPSKDTLQHVNQPTDPDADVSHLGAGSRGVFMRVDSIFSLEIPDGKSFRRECRVSGMLYELADQGWEEQNESCALKPPSQSNRSTATESFGTASLLSSNPMPIEPAITNESQTPSSGPSDAMISSHPPSSQDQADVPMPSSSGPVQAPPQREKPFGATLEAATQDQLSGGPRSSNYPLPRPPSGYKFRPVLTPGFEAALSPSVISGRYYPAVLQHPLLHNTVKENLGKDPTFADLSALLALEGLAPGFDNACDPTEWKESRATMVKAANDKAKKDIVTHWETRKQALDQQSKGDHGMDVDNPSTM